MRGKQLVCERGPNGFSHLLAKDYPQLTATPLLCIFFVDLIVLLPVILVSVFFQRDVFKLTFSINMYTYVIATGLSASAESIKRPSLRRNSSREKSRLHRSSSRRNKENGTKARGTSESSKSRSLETVKAKGSRVTIDQQPAEKIIKNSDEVIAESNNTGKSDVATIGPQDCTEMDVQTFHVTLTYKPRI